MNSRGLTLLSSVLVLGCFKADPSDGLADETGDSSGDGDATDDATGDATDDATGDGDGDGDEVDESGTDTSELGPQLISSTPEDGNTQAGIDGYFFLTFDRPVSAADATGNILASQDGGAATPVLIMPCPNADPACIAGIYPEALAPEGNLPGDTPHQIIVSADFPDPDGLTNTMDQTVDFTTFFYDANWYDDTANLDELWGLAYHPGGTRLFLSGENGVLNSDGPVIREVDLPGGSPQPGQTVATPMVMGGGPPSYGLDLNGEQLLVSMSYPSAVAVYGLAGMVPSLDETIQGPTLAAPYDSLDEVQSAVQAGDGRIFFGFGNFFGGDDRVGIVQRTGGGAWSIFNDGNNLWANNEVGMTLALGTIAGSEYLFAHNQDTIWQFRTSDGTLVQEHVLEESEWDAHMLVEDDRLWFGRSQGLIVFQVDGNGFTEVARRDGLDAGVFGVRTEATTAHVYYGGFRGDAVIGYTRVEF